MTLSALPPSDDAARRQIREELGQTLFVEAGAGTGKTAALVDRYLALVLGGQPVDRIVAITFTDKAAAELRDRIRIGLEGLTGDADQYVRERVQVALAGLDRAQISTIHAFCQALLRFFAARAGIDPAFEVQDEVAAGRRFEERWRLYLDGLGDDAAAVDRVGRLLDLGMPPTWLQQLARELWQRGELAERLQREPLRASATQWPDFTELLAELAAIPTATVPAEDALRLRIEGLSLLLHDLIAARREERDSLIASADLNPSLGNKGRAGNWRGAMPIDDARRVAGGVIKSLRATLEGLRSEALAEALPLIVGFVIQEAEARARDGALIFDDLILKTRDILRDNEYARTALRGRYETMLIDEFQDTDPLQADIAMYFARDSVSGKPEAGRLFLVGDPKQSIYRFRRADMAMYARMGAELTRAGARRVDLSLNRRSQPRILEWVNEVFASLMHGIGDLEVQPQYRPLAAERRDEPYGPAVAWIGGPEDAPAGVIRLLEARHVTAACREVVRRGWQVYDRANDEMRAARFGDIAVLLPARTILQPLERALTAEGIPYRVEGGSLVYATQEVRDLINCLTAIDDPTDGIAVVAALRSPAYACSDVEIATFRLRQGGSFNYQSRGLADLEGRVADSLRSLQSWHARRRDLSLASLVEGFLDEARLVEVGLLDSGSRNAFRRARFLVQQARAFEAAGPKSLRAFVDWLEGNASDAVLDQEGAGLDDDEDAVRVLTVHAAKGLEFPIVVMAGFGAEPRNQALIFGHDRGDASIAVQAGRSEQRFRLGPVDAVASHEAQHEIAERDRLLYVAATRARDHLVVSLFHRQNALNSGAARLLQNGAAALAEPLAAMDVTPGRSTSALAGLSVDTAEEEGFEEARLQLIASARRLSVTSATAMAREADAEDSKAEREDETEPWSRGRAGTRLGRAVHAALQSLPWDAGEATIEAVARAQTVAEAVPDMAGEAGHLIRVALASDAAQRARKATRALREVPFVFPQDGLLVEGFADLVIEHDDGIEIVDWKTDRVSGDAVDARLDRYRIQAGLYVLGIERATQRRVKSVTYVFVSPKREEAMGDPAELAAEALDRLRDMAATSA